ncbi:DUF4062 domain-containing protein [Hyphomicrobium sp. B1]|uniref:DUF4062 domain-containing protein n=1 Tax=Hyphomicrobium sp. B1 TaxID=3075651 RepID=UPI003C2EE09C
MDKRYQIFVSSTYSDLKEERQAVTQALLSLDHFPAGMELFPASDDDQWTLIKGVIDDSDYYVIVIAARYGSISPEGISYTEQEFDYAVSSGIPILAFLHETPDELPAKKTDQNDGARKKLTELRAKVQSDRHVKFWTNADDLRAKVIQAVSAETKRNPKVGWVRANLSSDPQRLNHLLQENEQLKEALSQARFSPPPGSESYSQGEDKFKAIMDVSKLDYGKYEDWLELEVSWNKIFYECGPLMMDEAKEGDLRRTLSSELPLYDEEKFEKYKRIVLTSDSFQTIKVQLVALGLIRKSARKHAPSDTNVYWSLTPFGEQYLTRLRAIKKRVLS